VMFGASNIYKSLIIHGTFATVIEYFIKELVIILNHKDSNTVPGEF